MVMKLMQVSEIAKRIGKHRNQVRGLILKNKLKPTEQRANIYGGVTNFYDIERLENGNL